MQTLSTIFLGLFWYIFSHSRSIARPTPFLESNNVWIILSSKIISPYEIITSSVISDLASIKEWSMLCENDFFSLIYLTFLNKYFSAKGPITRIMSSIPAFLNDEICLSIIDFPFTSIKGFGNSLVSSPNLRPLPAARIIAFINLVNFLEI